MVVGIEWVNILQLFASCSQNPKLLQWRTVLTTLAICRAYILDRLFDKQILLKC